MGSKIQMSLYKQISKILIACSYGLVCVDDTFSKPFNSYLGEDAVYSFIISIIQEYKYRSEVMEKPFN